MDITYNITSTLRSLHIFWLSKRSQSSKGTQIWNISFSIDQETELDQSSWYTKVYSHVVNNYKENHEIHEKNNSTIYCKCMCMMQHGL